jgi:hypothetical protein
MGLVRPGALLALIFVATAVAVVAAPAFATPSLTASSGTRAVAPFITPMGDTRGSVSSADSIDTRLNLGAFTITCRTATMAGYVTVTHTQLRLTSFAFGNGRGGTCSASGGAVVDGDAIVGSATSAAPWHLHVRANDALSRSATGTLNVSSPFSFTITFGGGVSCVIRASAPQSVAVTYTYNTTSLVLNGTLMVTVSGGGFCPAGGTLTLGATYTFRPSTSRHRLAVTTGS